MVCWDTQVKHDQTVECLEGAEQRTVKIVPPESGDDYTCYFLEGRRDPRRIEVFVLKCYLKDKLGIEFRPRTEESVV